MEKVILEVKERTGGEKSVYGGLAFFDAVVQLCQKRGIEHPLYDRDGELLKIVIKVNPYKINTESVIRAIFDLARDRKDIEIVSTRAG